MKHLFLIIAFPILICACNKDMGSIPDPALGPRISLISGGQYGEYGASDSLFLAEYEGDLVKKIVYKTSSAIYSYGDWLEIDYSSPGTIKINEFTVSEADTPISYSPIHDGKIWYSDKVDSTLFNDYYLGIFTHTFKYSYKEGNLSLAENIRSAYDLCRDFTYDGTSLTGYKFCFDGNISHYLSVEDAYLDNTEDPQKVNTSVFNNIIFSCSVSDISFLSPIGTTIFPYNCFNRGYSATGLKSPFLISSLIVKNMSGEIIDSFQFEYVRNSEGRIQSLIAHQLPGYTVDYEFHFKYLD